MKSLLDLLLPWYCPCCKRVTEQSEGLCADCWRKINFMTKPICSRCGAALPFEEPLTHTPGCKHCIHYHYFFDQALSACVYSDISKNLLLRFKKNDELYLKKVFTRWLCGVSKSWLEHIHIIAPIPFHYLKMIKRTYNQALLLSEDYYQHIHKNHILHIPDLLKSHKPYSIHSRTDLHDRFQALFNTMSFNPQYAKIMTEKNILLIDDVMTTGATMSEASRILKREGARNVYALTIARTLKNV